MITYRGFTAWITCNNIPLPVFEVIENEKLHRMTCWIPSISGQRFSIHWRDEGGGVDTAAYINLDGTVVSGRFLFGSGETCRDGFRTGANTERPFMFMDVVDSGVSKPELTSKHVKELGTIMLRIKRIRRTTSKFANRIQSTPIEAVNYSREHCVGYGPERDTYEQYSTTWSFEPYDNSAPGSYATFVFRYRSTEFLISEGIMTPGEAPVIPIVDSERFTAATPEEAAVSPPSTSGESTGTPFHEEITMEHAPRSTVPSPSSVTSKSSNQPWIAQDNGILNSVSNVSGPGPDRTNPSTRLRERRIPSYSTDKSKQRKVTYTRRVKYPGESMLVFKSIDSDSGPSRPSDGEAESSQ